MSRASLAGAGLAAVSATGYAPGGAPGTGAGVADGRVVKTKYAATARFALEVADGRPPPRAGAPAAAAAGEPLARASDVPSPRAEELVRCPVSTR